MPAATNKTLTCDTLGETDVIADIDCDYISLFNLGTDPIWVATKKGDTSTRETVQPNMQWAITSPVSNATSFPPRGDRWRFRQGDLVATIRAQSGVVDVLRKCVS
jgi:hypothetical protein